MGKNLKTSRVSNFFHIAIGDNLISSEILELSQGLVLTERAVGN